MPSDDLDLVCPRCLCVVNPSALQYQDREGALVGAPVTPRPSAGQWVRAISYGDPDRLYKADLGRAIADDERGVRGVCPNGHDLPAELYDHPTIKIALVGLASSGKTVFLGTLLDELVEKGRLDAVGIGAKLEQRSRAEFTRRFAGFLDEDIAPKGTTPDESGVTIEPLMIFLTTPSQQRVNVLVYDADGSRLDRAEDIANFARALYVADAVIYFLPPSALPKAESVRGTPRPDEKQSYTKTVQAMHTSIEALRKARPNGRNLFGAIVIPKSDDLAETSLGSSSSLLDDLPYERFSDLEECVDVIEDDSVIINGFMKESGARSMVSEVQRFFGATSFHLASCLASATEVDGRFSEGRAARRVLDPFIEAVWHSKKIRWDTEL